MYETRGNMTLFAWNKPFYLYSVKSLLKKSVEIGGPSDKALVLYHLFQYQNASFVGGLNSGNKFNRQ